MDFPAVVNDNAVADILHVRKQMAAEDDRFAAARQCQDQVLYFPAADRVQIVENRPAQRSAFHRIGTGAQLIQENQAAAV